MLRRPAMTRLSALLLVLFALLPGAASAQGLSARFSNQVATLGAPLTVQIEVEGAPGLVDRIQIELRRPDAATWTATTAHPVDPPAELQRWAGTFDARTLWPTDRAAPESLELRALLYGRRGGLMLVVGEISPFQMDVLTPAKAAMRARAMGRPATTNAPAAAPIPVAGYVGADGRLGSNARVRAFIAAGGPVAAQLELMGVVSVGPSFSEPDDLSGSGPFTLGFEIALRAYTFALDDGAWNLFAQPYLSADVRLPGFDAGVGSRVGLLYWLSDEVGADISLGGALTVLGLAPAGGETRNLGFVGGLRIGIRFGPERS